MVLKLQLSILESGRRKELTMSILFNIILHKIFQSYSASYSLVKVRHVSFFLQILIWSFNSSEGEKTWEFMQALCCLCRILIIYLKIWYAMYYGNDAYAYVMNSYPERIFP